MQTRTRNGVETKVMGKLTARQEEENEFFKDVVNTAIKQNKGELPKSKDQLIYLLQEAGVEINRTGAKSGKYISVKANIGGKEKSVRLKGGIFDTKNYDENGYKKMPEGESKRRGGSVKEYKAACERLDKLIEKRTNYFNERFAKKIGQTIEKPASSFEPKVVENIRARVKSKSSDRAWQKSADTKGMSAKFSGAAAAPAFTAPVGEAIQANTEIGHENETAFDFLKRFERLLANHKARQEQQSRALKSPEPAETPDWLGDLAANPTNYDQRYFYDSITTNDFRNSVKRTADASRRAKTAKAAADAARHTTETSNICGNGASGTNAELNIATDRVREQTATTRREIELNRERHKEFEAGASTGVGAIRRIGEIARNRLRKRIGVRQIIQVGERLAHSVQSFVSKIISHFPNEIYLKSDIKSDIPKIANINNISAMLAAGKFDESKLDSIYRNAAIFIDGKRVLEVDSSGNYVMAENKSSQEQAVRREC